MLRFVIAIPMLAHGLAHLSGVLASWTSTVEGFRDEPWLFFSATRLSDPLGRVFGLFWLAAMAVLVASGLGVVLRQPWWPTMALIGTALSLAAIVPWWRAVPLGAKLGAAFDLILLALLLSPLRAWLLALVGQG